MNKCPKALATVLAVGLAVFSSSYIYAAPQEMNVLLSDATEKETLTEKEAIHLRETGEDLSIARKSGGRRLLSSSADGYSIENVFARQVEGTKFVKITYDLISSGDRQYKVSLSLQNNGNSVSATTLSGDIGRGVAPGSGKSIVWDAGKDWPNGYSEKFTAIVSAEETDIPVSWANITVSWGAYGGRDLDICGYWLDQPSTKVGWSYGSGSTSSTWRSRWEGDNTGSGPEYIHVGVNENDIAQGVADRRYRIHFNYYGEVGSSAQATVYVTANGITKSASSPTGTHTGTKAYTSDPYLTITFDSHGSPISIE